MNDKPLMLDTFCSAGGCTKGYQMAGFKVAGIDINAQPRYCGEDFVQGDALALLDALLSGEAIGERGYRLNDFAAIHASPPCQSYSRAMRHLATPQPMLIEPVRKLLEATGRPWVIENVPGAVLPTAIVLCGSAFGLRVYRHRHFDSNVPMMSPGCDHSRPAMNPHRTEGRERIYAEFGRQDPEKIWRDAMGVTWMNRHETREAIPPAYTEYIGRYLR